MQPLSPQELAQYGKQFSTEALTSLAERKAQWISRGLASLKDESERRALLVMRGLYSCGQGPSCSVASALAWERGRESLYTFRGFPAPVQPGSAPRYNVERDKDMSANLKPVPDPERADRQARVERAMASVRLEGLEPTDAAKAIFDRYVAGDLTIEEMGAEIRALNAREFGPVHVSGD